MSGHYCRSAREAPSGLRHAPAGLRGTRGAGERGSAAPGCDKEVATPRFLSACCPRLRNSTLLWADDFHELSVPAQTAVIQEDKGRESVASTVETNGIFRPLRLGSPKRPQSPAGSSSACPW
jgi:hypothetical protein